VPLIEWQPDPPRPDIPGGPFPLVCANGCAPLPPVVLAAFELAREEPQRPNDAQAAVAAELERILEAPEYRAGALFVTREPLPGPELDTRIVSAIGMSELNEKTAVDLVHLIKALRRAADDLEARFPPLRGAQ
jgi:hypothetical protein